MIIGNRRFFLIQREKEITAHWYDSDLLYDLF